MQNEKDGTHVEKKINIKDVKKSSSQKKVENINAGNEKTKDFKKEIEALRLKLKEAQDDVLRGLAENDNLRKRHQRELEEALKYANKNFSTGLLSVADNFQRAMKFVPEKLPEGDELLTNLITGLRAIEKEFYDVFEKNGITRFSSVDQKFDPDIHQAVSQSFSNVKEGFVLEELQQGFKIGERLLRPSMVVVSKGPNPEEKNNQKKTD